MNIRVVFQFQKCATKQGNVYSCNEFLVNQTVPNQIPKTKSRYRIPESEIQGYRIPILKSYSCNQTDPKRN